LSHPVVSGIPSNFAWTGWCAWATSILLRVTYSHTHLDGIDDSSAVSIASVTGNIYDAIARFNFTKGTGCVGLTPSTSRQGILVSSYGNVSATFEFLTLKLIIN
jgi:hypothetical protein